MFYYRKKIENNRQILTRLRQFLRTNSNEFQICVNEIKTSFMFDENEKNNFTNDFFNVFDEKSNVIIDKWKTIILNNTTIFESIIEMIARKHIHEHNATYDDKIINNFVELIRSLLKQNSCAIQMKQKLIIFDKSHSHWHDEKKIL